MPSRRPATTLSSRSAGVRHSHRRTKPAAAGSSRSSSGDRRVPGAWPFGSKHLARPCESPPRHLLTMVTSTASPSAAGSTTCGARPAAPAMAGASSRRGHRLEHPRGDGRAEQGRLQLPGRLGPVRHLWLSARHHQRLRRRRPRGPGEAADPGSQAARHHSTSSAWGSSAGATTRSSGPIRRFAARTSPASRSTT